MQAHVAAYQGSEPFVFVCYSHEDADSVYREISWLHDCGIFVWYDEGISPGSEWSEELARRIEECAVFIFYSSIHSVQSPHCRGEINFALDQSCHMLVVHLEDAEQSAGLRLSLGNRQALMKYELRDEIYQRKLLSALQLYTRSANETPRDFVPEHLARKVIESGTSMIGERKQVSVMTVNVANVGGLWDLDPEESHEILQSCRELLTGSVNRFEGTVHQFSNEGVVALFGAPIAHEDHAQRACFAALHLQEAVRDWADQLRRTKGISFSARIGIDSGEIVIKSVGDDLRVELEAHGRAVGVAASVQQLAEPSRTYISRNTARHVEGYVALRSLGSFDLQGYPDGIELFELEGMGNARTRLDRARARGLSRFVGRHNEMQSLDGALQRAREGGGQVVSVVAEAGTGKSRLCSEFVDQCRRNGLVVYQAHCPVHGKSVPLLPILELLRSYFDIAAGDQPLQVREKITGRLILLDTAFEEELPLLFEFLGVPDPELPQSGLEAEARQQRLYAFLSRLVQSHSQREPLIMFIDDLHWIDDASAGYVAQLVDSVATTNSLLLVNFRPSEYSAPWAARSYHLQMPLMPLTLDSTEELVTGILGSDSSLRGLAARVHERTQGNPFFTEEVVRTLIESGQLEKITDGYRLTGSVDALDVPPDVQAILQARIDRLGEAEKRLLHRAAVIGKDFDETILREVSDLPQEQLEPALAALVETEFLVQRAIYPVAEYSFKHPLTHQVAQETQLKAPRQQAHAAVAAAIQRLYPDDLDERAAQVARHLEGAADNREAASWYGRAAEWSEKNDLRSCFSYWHHIPELLTDHDGTETDQLKLEACRKISQLAWRVHGDESQSRQVQNTIQMGLDLARKLGEVDSIIEIFLGNAMQALVTQGDYGQAEQLINQAKELTAETTDPLLKVSILFFDSLIELHIGNVDKGKEVLREYQEQWPKVGVQPLVAVPVFCTDDAGEALRAYWHFFEGALDESITSCHAFARLVHANGNPETLGQISHTAALLSYFYGSAVEGGEKYNADAQAAGESLGNPNFNMIADGAHGAFLYYAGALSEARSVLEQTRQAFPKGNTTNCYRGYLIKVLLALGETDEALQIAEEGLEYARGRSAGFEQLILLVEKCRVMLASDQQSTAIAGVLEQCEALLEQTAARAFTPQIQELWARARLQEGQTQQADELFRQALSGYLNSGAVGHADRLREMLEQSGSAPAAN